MADTLPPPLVPAEVDLRGLEWMPYYGNRLFGSDFDAHADDTAFRAGHQLWWASWNQVPAASLPNDDVALCRLAGLGRDARTWKRIKASATRGFVLCSDGRLYHRTLSQWAVQAWDRRRRDRDRKAKWRASQEQPRPDEKDAPVTPPVPVSGTDERRGEERTGEENKKKEEAASPPVADAPPPPPAVEQPPALAPEPDDGMPGFLVAGEVGEALKLWNEAAERIGLPTAQKLTDSRRKAIKARLSESGGLDGWRCALAKVEASSFLAGKTGRTGEHANWRCDLDFILRQAKFTKLMEGGFDDPPGGTKPRSGLSSSLEALAEFGRTGTG